MTNEEWGGDWTKQKLDAFEKYVKAYLNIMYSQKKNRSGWPKIIYFDGFAGSGYKKTKINSDENLLFPNFQVNKDIYSGSPERVVKLDKKFDKYIFVDINKNSIEALKEKLKSYKVPNIEYINSDVNEELIKLSKNLDETKAALVLLDPFGMQINWNSIACLKGLRVDLWILIPSGVAINRLLDNNGELKNIDRIKDFLGLGKNEIEQFFYNKTATMNLFKEKEENMKKIAEPIRKISELYIKQMGKIWKYVTKYPLVLPNSKNVPIYHFAFASNNKTAEKIASQIVEEKHNANYKN